MRFAFGSVLVFVFLSSAVWAQTGAASPCTSAASANPATAPDPCLSQNVEATPSLSAPSSGANSASPSDPIQHSEFSIQVNGVYTSHSASSPVTHFDTRSAGLLFAYRIHLDRWEAIEFQYGYTRNGQRYITPPTAPALPATFYGIASSMQQALADEVVTTPRILGFLQPFVLAGGGAAIFRPRASDIVPASAQTRPAANLGAGVDFHIVHVGARLEFQALGFKIPDFKNPLLTTNKWEVVSEPSAGLIFTF